MGISIKVLIMLIAASLVISIAGAYVAVVTQNPKPPVQALYGPGDFAP